MPLPGIWNRWDEGILQMCVGEGGLPSSGASIGWALTGSVYSGKERLEVYIWTFLRGGLCNRSNGHVFSRIRNKY